MTALPASGATGTLRYALNGTVMTTRSPAAPASAEVAARARGPRLSTSSLVARRMAARRAWSSTESRCPPVGVPKSVQLDHSAQPIDEHQLAKSVPKSCVVIGCSNITDWTSLTAWKLDDYLGVAPRLALDTGSASERMYDTAHDIEAEA